MHEPINIYSGASGLGGALTNPTELARKKGCIDKAYPVVFRGRRWPDVETAYQVLAGEEPDIATRDKLMHELIAAKFVQHPDLQAEVAERGGRQWLEQCTHWTGAKSERFQRWEGRGLESRFIRNLAEGYELAGAAATEEGQLALF
jgi:hypothetical protein